MMGGLFLFLLSVSYSLFYDGFIAPTQHSSLLYNLDMALNMAAKGDLTMASTFAGQFGTEVENGAIQARIPVHLALAGAMTAVPLWVTPKLDISERMKRIMALFIVFGGVVLASGDLIQVMAVKIGYYIMLAGYAWLILGLLGYFLYTVLYVWLHEEEQKPKRRSRC
jgi:heme A synthase